MGKIVVQKGVISPDRAALQDLLSQIEVENSKNPRLKEMLRSNPNGYFSSVGLNEDVRRELLNSAGQAAQASCTFTCVTTCWFTDCAITNISW
jgi:hypothetical protein